MTPSSRPLRWVPTLYIAMGLPMVAVSQVAAIMYKNLGISNADIAFHTGLLTAPWMLKPLWAAVVDMFRTKKFFVLAMEVVMMVTLGCVALSLPLPSFLPWTLAFFWITAFASSTQDIAADGVYITSTTPKEQALYVGLQGICWNAGAMISSGLLVWFTGYLHTQKQLDWPKAWMVVMGIMAALMGLAALWHARVLPPGSRVVDAPTSLREGVRIFVQAWVGFFQKKRIWMMIVVIFFYRFGEGLIEKIAPLFLVDKRALGGLGLDNAAVGSVYGTGGTIAFIVGTLLGGAFAARYGLRRTFFLLAIGLNIPHVTYYFLGATLPTDLTLIAVMVIVEKLGFGFGSVGHMLYMMQQVAPGPFKTSHYAFATALMGLTRMVTGMTSGVIQEALGYEHFFLVVLLASVPPIVLAWMAPFPVANVPESQPGPATPT